MRVTDAWALLGLEPTDDAREVKRAYGRLLKQIDVDADPAAFIRLRDARDTALSWGVIVPDWEKDGEDWLDEEALAFADGEDDPAPPDPVSLQADEDVAHPIPMWRPVPLPAEDERLGALCRELEDLLFAPERPDPERLLALGEQILALCRTAQVDVGTQTERWLLSTLAASIPKSDPLIEPAIRHFRWESAVRSKDFDAEYDIDTLLQRVADRDILRPPMALDESGRKAAAELMQPGRARLGPFKLGLARDVRLFLEKTLPAHPTIEHDLDADTLAWWRNYFARRHLPENFWRVLFLLPPPLAFFALMIFASVGAGPPSFDYLFPIFYGLSVVTVVSGMLFGIELRFMHAARQEKHWDAYPPRGAAPWLAAAMVLPPLSLLLAFNHWSALVWTLTAAIVAVGINLSTASPHKGRGTNLLLAKRGVPAIVMVACVAFAFRLSGHLLAHVAASILVLCYMAYRGQDAAAGLVGTLPERLARGLLVAAILLSAALVAVLIAWAPALPPPPLLALVLALVALQYLAVAHHYLDTGKVEWAVRTAAIIFYFFVAPFIYPDHKSNALAAAILIYTLAYSAIRSGLAFPRVGHKVEPIPYF